MDYIFWRFGKGFGSYWIFVGRICRFLLHIFAVRLLLRTLFWPWKRDFTLLQKQGFYPGEWLKRHGFNLFARIIGFTVKILAIILWFLAEIFWLALAAVFFPVWITAPLVIFYLLFLTANLVPKINADEINSIISVIACLIAIALLTAIELRVRKNWRISKLLKPDRKKPNPKDPWFQSLCAHLLLPPAILKDAWINEKLRKILVGARLTREEFDKITDYEIQRQIAGAKKRSWWRRENLLSQKPFTEDWVFGWTFTLNRFARTIKPLGNSSGLSINSRELKILKNYLAENTGVNVVIVGEAGTQRERLLENLSFDIDNRDVPPALLSKKIMELHLDNLLAASNFTEEKVLLLQKALLEAVNAGNVILFIPSLSSYLASSQEESDLGQADISTILVNLLNNTGLQIVTLATPGEIHQVLQDKPQLVKYFELIKLEEPGLEDSLIIMIEKSFALEQKFGKLITYGATKRALEAGYRYLQDRAMPQRALGFLEETINFLADNRPNDHIIKENEVNLYASEKIGQSAGKLENEEKEKLLNLEREMQKRIVGQKEAIAAVASAMRRRRLDLSSPERPAGCFLFLGPTGVGKTHTAETLAKLYFSGEENMARLDMSEYQEENAITKLLGDAEGKIEGYFHKILVKTPFSLILLDELEKAANEVHQLLLQIMEEGIAKTGTGIKLNFRETIIIATSNAEALLVQELVRKNEEGDILKKTVVDKIQKDGIFSPELLNRFDEIVLFHPLSQADLIQIAGMALSDLKKRLEEKEILISYDRAFQNKLAQVGFDPVFGARELRRAIEKQIEDAIAKDLLAGKIVKGKEFTLPMEYLKEN
ncbi:MAG: ATP-dependent Clp protease ATP-binding subunit [Candidatus Moranbacteria bacterium]|nr:ATP-dependent Clp protease ATP-binding subunit [Candidatus Moranbacteria bacterium]